ncbi:hypothetical protein JNUCC0626_40165 [Lentzea sp. JNUCC 0626]|uniref:hypothetical protein n=1 Tax=Lentzea sp. JNUCC 0626 TaxID=3367513 RepID=UPI0037497C3B
MIPKNVQEACPLSDTTPPAPSTEDSTTDDQQAPGSAAPADGAEVAGDGTPSAAVKPEDDLPEWARKELTKVRGEAANYRTQLRAAQESLSNAKTPEEFQAATAQLSAKVTELETSLLRSSVARKYDLPDELAERLRGSTAEEMESDAKALQKFAGPVTPESLGGGLTPDSTDDGEMDPRKLARRTRR